MSADSKSSSSMEITINDISKNMEPAADSAEKCYLPGLSGEPKTCPRIGDQYQAVIPDLIEGNESLESNADKVNKRIQFLLPALPIPLMWVPNKVRDEESLRALHGMADPYAEENQVALNSENSSILTEDIDTRLEADMMKLDASSCEGIERPFVEEEKNLYPLPGTPDEPWSDFEQDAFLLALYIFGKDLYLVKKLVETKKMEDVISFYYGSFYKCSKYQRWAKCLRSRSIKSIHGQRIFTGRRQQELFSRLNRHLSEETSKKLEEASKSFMEEGISFEDYVFTLRDLVGTKLLIKVVAVGKGNQDLTGIASKPQKLDCGVSFSQETQKEKGLSSLSCKEIAEQLTSSRLSKTKSNDLFWEAVWPRLLARGWHSEQPKNHRVLSLKHQLVFLMPGVDKFRRKRHVKGQHYFDSVSDVLKKVALDPRILELEDEKEETIGQENHSEEQDVDLPERKHNGYLNMCNSDQRKNEMEFMIVDTSKRQGSKVHWMQTLPVQRGDISSSSSACSGRDSSSEKSDGEGDSTQRTKCGIYSQMANGIGFSKKQKIDNVYLKKKSSKKHRRGGKVKSGSSKYLSSFKRHQINAAGLEDSGEAMEAKIDGGLILCLPNPCKVIENNQCHKVSDTRVSPPNSAHMVTISSHSSLPNPLSQMAEGSACIVSVNFKEIGRPLEQPLHQAVIDLNISQAPDNVETNHGMIKNYLCSLAQRTSPAPANKCKNTFQTNTSSTCGTSQQIQEAGGSNIEHHQPPATHHQDLQLPKVQQKRQLRTPHDQEPNMYGRRQGTRNRPLTTKALEAIESSFFDTKKKRKTTDSLTTGPSRRQSGNSKSNKISDNGIGSNDMR